MSFSPPLKIARLPARDDGVLVYGTGVLYKGSLDEKQRSGPGVLTFPDGSVYEGLFLNNKRNGDGLQTWHDGSKYTGEFSGDLRQGHGQQQFPDGSMYVGTFAFDRRHGTGKYTQNDGSTFEGSFYMDKREGYGTLTFSNKETFQGLYKADQREGPGVWTHSDGTQDVGLWHGDKLAKLCSSAPGAFRMADHPEFDYDRRDHVPNVSFSLRDANRNDVISGILKPLPPFDYCDSRNQAAAVFLRCLGAESLGLDRQTFEREFFNAAATAAESAPRPPTVTEAAWNATPASVAMQRHVLRHRSDVIAGGGPSSSMLLRDSKSTAAAAAAAARALQAVLSGTRPAACATPGALESRSAELLRAAREGDTALARRILMSGDVSVDVADCGGCTALLVAATSCHAEVINCLLDYGADINAVTDEGLSPLAVCFVYYYPRETFKANIAETAYVIATAPAGYVGSAAADAAGSRASGTSSQDGSSASRARRHPTGTAATAAPERDSSRSATPAAKAREGADNGQSAALNSTEATAVADERKTPADSVSGTEPVVEDKSAVDEVTAVASSNSDPVATKAAPADLDDRHNDRSDSDGRRPDGDASLSDATESERRRPAPLRLVQAASDIELDRLAMPDEDVADEPVGDADGESERVTVEHPVAPVSRHLVNASAVLLSRNERAVRGVSATLAAADLSRDVRSPYVGQEAVRVLAARIAERAKRWETIQLLLRRGANPSVSTAPLPPLIFAIKAADVEAVRLLLLRGADVNVTLPAKAGCLTPLHLAVATPGPEGPLIVEHLLNALANPDARALPDTSYLMTHGGGGSSSNGRDEDDDEPTPQTGGGANAAAAEASGLATAAAAAGRERQRSADRTLGGLISAGGGEGRTPLHIACSRDDDYELAARIVGLLLEHKANPDVVCNGHSPLSLAIVSGNDLAVDRLLRHGANPSLVLTHGNGSALCVAAHTAYEHRREPAKRIALIDKLISSGADILALTTIGGKKTNGTAVDYAYHVFNQDRRIAHMPYHALTHSERETYNARRQLLAHLGDILREKFIERESKRIEEEQLLGLPSRNASAKFHYNAAGKARDVSSAPTRTGAAAGAGNAGGGGLLAVPSAAANKVTFSHEEFFGVVPTASQLAAGIVTIGPLGTKSTRILESLEEQSKTVVRKPTFKYCYNCGRSVGVRLTACTRCKEVYFCSKPCKLRAWNTRHKDECVRIQGSKASSAAQQHRKTNEPLPELKQKAKATLVDGHRVVTHKAAAMERSYNLRSDPRILVPVKGRSHSLSDLRRDGKFSGAAAKGVFSEDKAARALRELKIKEKADAEIAQAKAELAQRLAFEDNYSFE